MCTPSAHGEVEVAVRVGLVLEREMPPLLRKRLEPGGDHRLTENPAVPDLGGRQPLREIGMRTASEQDSS